MNNYANNDYLKFQEYAESIGMTPEDYALSLHRKHQKQKAILLQKGPQFKEFVEEFHSLLDNMVIYKESGEQTHSHETHDLFKKFVHLLTTASGDPKLLAQLYNHYPNGIENELNEFKTYLV